MGTGRSPRHPAPGPRDLHRHPRHHLDALIEHAGLDLTGAPAHRHRATFDAYATALLLLRMAGRYDTWDALAQAAVPPGLPGAPEPEEDPTLW
ncbi:hypothetical protein LHJ74_26040 [Streptomyces sp. N2-109]|uniref:Uncharacterized protein n=1 Tax=Streptomyces gossypii TaxID=2883101 RepID=A0ABT2JZJ0_9ACTN|nr:hypothetical protein [Streptomyces gossypii]MCT2593325.1 hypothetical protein [Streptomyces gossypii]